MDFIESDSIFKVDPTDWPTPSNETPTNYLPFKFPCSDYEGYYNYNTASSESLYPLVPSQINQFVTTEPTMTADQCRWLWRLGNYVRRLSVRNEIDDNDLKIINIVLSSSYANYIGYKQHGGL